MNARRRADILPVVKAWILAILVTLAGVVGLAPRVEMVCDAGGASCPMDACAPTSAPSPASIPISDHACCADDAAPDHASSKHAAGDLAAGAHDHPARDGHACPPCCWRSGRTPATLAKADGLRTPEAIEQPALLAPLLTPRSVSHAPRASRPALLAAPPRSRLCVWVI